MNTNKWKEVNNPEELFCLKREVWEIEFFDPLYACWLYWNGKSWFSNIKYRARPKQPKMKQIKVEAYLSEYELRWLNVEAENKPPPHWVRVPAEDKIIEVPDDH